MSKPNTIRCGIDEVGRGPLAGPVTAAAVVLPPSFDLSVLGDSKTLSLTRRQRVEEMLLSSETHFHLGWARPDEIDAINIHHASLLAMHRAYTALIDSLRLDHLVSTVETYVDGKFCPPEIPACTAVIGGDRLIPEIMAAAILAKNARDRLMVELSNAYPEYGFEQHKGYPTAAHKRAIALHGPCRIHRRSFRGVSDLGVAARGDHRENRETR